MPQRIAEVLQKITSLSPMQSEPFIGAPMSAIAEEPSGEDTTSNEGSEHSPASRHDSTDNIRLQRVTGVSMRHTKPPPVSVMKEGWMVHYTNKSSQVRRQAGSAVRASCAA